jgi:hypothetical protein
MTVVSPSMHANIHVCTSLNLLSLIPLHRRPGYYVCRGPKYGKSREKVIKAEMLDLRLADTVTNIVVPTFDMNMMVPVTFSSFKNNEERLLRYKLSDVCIATTAAPTYFRPYPMQGRVGDLNLVDGGIVANNPTMMAVAAVERQIVNGDKDFSRVPATDQDDLKTGFKKYLILSIGTQYNRGTGKYTAARAERLGKIGWARPAIKMLCCASEFTVNYNIAVFLRSQGDPDNYLRIQATVRNNTLPLNTHARPEYVFPNNSVYVNYCVYTSRMGHSMTKRCHWTPLRKKI